MRRAIPNNPASFGHCEPPTVEGLLKCPAPLRLTYLKPKRFPQDEHNGAVSRNTRGKRSRDQVAPAQLSSCRPGTLANSRVLLVTSRACWLRAWAAIMVSSAPMGVPRRSRSARKSP